MKLLNNKSAKNDLKNIKAEILNSTVLDLTGECDNKTIERESRSGFRTKIAQHDYLKSFYVSFLSFLTCASGSLYAISGAGAMTRYDLDPVHIETRVLFVHKE